MLSLDAAIATGTGEGYGAPEKMATTECEKAHTKSHTERHKPCGNSLAYNPRACRKLRNLTEKSIVLEMSKSNEPPRPDVSWRSGTNRHAPLPVWTCLSRFSVSFALVVAPRREPQP